MSLERKGFHVKLQYNVAPDIGQKSCNVASSKGGRKGGLGLLPPMSLIFYKTLLPAQRRLTVFAYVLLVNLST